MGKIKYILSFIYILFFQGYQIISEGEILIEEFQLINEEEMIKVGNSVLFNSRAKQQSSMEIKIISERLIRNFVMKGQVDTIRGRRPVLALLNFGYSDISTRKHTASSVMWFWLKKKI